MKKIILFSQLCLVLLLVNTGLLFSKNHNTFIDLFPNSIIQEDEKFLCLSSPEKHFQSANFINPKIICPVNVTIQCEAVKNPTGTGTASATDNCTSLPTEISNISYSDSRLNGSCQDNYNIYRTWSAKDSCNNISTCTQTIVVFDTARPRIFCPENISITCEASTSPANTGTAYSFDNCSDKITNISYSDVRTNGACFDDYTLDREWRAVDSCGNSNTCAQLITIQDYTKPLITCSSNITINCEASTLPANTGIATAVDNCTNVVTNITYDDVLVFEGNGSYTISRTWSAIDSCSNARTCLQKITISDTLKADSVKITNSSIANDGKIQFYITGVDSLRWYNLSNNQYVNNNGLNLSPGEYFVKVYRGACRLLYGPFQIQLINSVNDLNEFNLKAFPVPFKDEISVSAESKTELDYILLNVQGSILIKGKFRNGSTIKTGHLNTGVYFLRFSDNNKSGMIRLIKM
jgi:hypothetical protein